MVIGGARTTPGAAMLAGTAALRAGAGRLTLAVAESVAMHVAVSLPEAGVTGLPETADGSVLGSGLEPILSELGSADAVLIGPGLDDIDLTGKLLRALLELDSDGVTGRGSVTGDATIILDAYALGCLPRLEDSLDPWRGRLILTPNPQEAGILLGKEIDQLESAVAAIAARYQAVVSCQGFVARPAAGRRTARPPAVPTCGRSPPVTAGWGRPAAGTSWPVPSPGSAPAAPATPRQPAGAATFTRLRRTGWPAGWVRWVSWPANWPTNCPR